VIVRGVFIQEEGVIKLIVRGVFIQEEGVIKLLSRDPAVFVQPFQVGMAVTPVRS